MMNIALVCVESPYFRELLLHCHSGLEPYLVKSADTVREWIMKKFKRQKLERVGGSEVDSFNSKVNGKVNTLQQRGRNLYIRQSKTFIFYYITLLVVPS